MGCECTAHMIRHDNYGRSGELPQSLLGNASKNVMFLWIERWADKGQASKVKRYRTFT